MMSKFDETLKKVCEEVKNLMTEENISDEKLEKLTGLNNDLKELGTQHQELTDKYATMKDKYIESITNFGTSKKPDEIGGSPKSFEEIASEVLAQEK